MDGVDYGMPIIDLKRQAGQCAKEAANRILLPQNTEAREKKIAIPLRVAHALRG
jgi:hypothetical protein